MNYGAGGGLRVWEGIAGLGRDHGLGGNYGCGTELQSGEGTLESGEMHEWEEITVHGNRHQITYAGLASPAQPAQLTHDDITATSTLNASSSVALICGGAGILGTSPALPYCGLRQHVPESSR